ncbi:MAG: hypothetical protein LBI39_02020 [Puniceicoccales bacterium]|nr:hypothetical protein [Puniceicoccales bacterium]
MSTYAGVLSARCSGRSVSGGSFSAAVVHYLNGQDVRVTSPEALDGLLGKKNNTSLSVTFYGNDGRAVETVQLWHVLTGPDLLEAALATGMTPEGYALLVEEVGVPQSGGGGAPKVLRGSILCREGGVVRPIDIAGARMRGFVGCVISMHGKSNVAGRDIIVRASNPEDATEAARVIGQGSSNKAQVVFVNEHGGITVWDLSPSSKSGPWIAFKYTGVALITSALAALIGFLVALKFVLPVFLIALAMIIVGVTSLVMYERFSGNAA